MKRLRVLIVDDSLTVREALRELLEADPRFEVVGTARSGDEGLQLWEQESPDVITLDMAMPGMSGLEFTATVMQRAPCPILIVSSSLERGEALSTLDALAAGAVEVFDKEEALEADARGRSRLCDTLALVARVPVVRHVKPRGRRLVTPVAEVAPAPAGCDGPPIVALGASTGGPRALRAILGRFRVRPDVATLAVVHMSGRFGSRLAEWLDGALRLPVRHAEDGEPLLAADGSVRLAPPDRHLCVEGDRLRLTSAPPRHGCRPSVEVLFRSLVARGPDVHAALLTGMGGDGADALLSLRREGAVTYAQDEASSVVWGMPGRAVSLGAATHVLSVSSLAQRLARVGDP